MSQCDPLESLEQFFVHRAGYCLQCFASKIGAIGHGSTFDHLMLKDFWGPFLQLYKFSKPEMSSTKETH